MSTLPRRLTDVVRLIAADPNAINTAEALWIINRLKASKPLTLESKLSQLTTLSGVVNPPAWKAQTLQCLREFMAFIPESFAADVPTFEVQLAPRTGNVAGSYFPDNKTLLLTTTPFLNQFKATVFHELAHWLHLEGEGALKLYRHQIKSHFDARTKGEATAILPGYNTSVVGKKDNFWTPYMGREYVAIIEGSEIPPAAFELLNNPYFFAEKWNNLIHRETLEIAFSILLP